MAVLDEVAAERERQDAKWGEQNHTDAPRSIQMLGIRGADDARHACELAARCGLVTWAHILVEEVCEAVEAGNDDEALRAELVQVAAVAVAWVEAIDRRKARGVLKGSGDDR